MYQSKQQPNKLTIQINGMRYNIKTNEDPDYVLELAHEIDQEVRSVMATANASMAEALILLALSSLDKARKAESGTDHLRVQITEYAEEAKRLRKEVARLESRLAAGSKSS